MDNIIEEYCKLWDRICGYPVDYVQVFALTILALFALGAVLSLLTLPMSVGGVEGWLLIIIGKFFWAFLQSVIVTTAASLKIFSKNFQFFWENEKKGAKGKSANYRRKRR
ncbi:MAG: hypothetical protein IJN92_10160 [Lachnospiraceae bacterium]|nr:hypothetical protein [Lachnospiraceae bacterium]